MLTIYSAITGRSIPELVEHFEGKMYGALKTELAEVYSEWVTPIQERTRSYLDDPAELDRVLARGAEKARAVAGETLATAYDRIGFLAAKR